MTEPPDRQLQFLQELLAENATIAGDVVEIGTDTWAIHGSILVDGDVILAEYDSRAKATDIVEQLAALTVEPLPTDASTTGYPTLSDGPIGPGWMGL